MSKNQKFFVAANIVGATTVHAENIEEAQKKALKIFSKRYTLQKLPAGVMVFDPANPPSHFEAIPNPNSDFAPVPTPEAAPVSDTVAAPDAGV
jgi:hypothetical protein